mmetsp:Transcript_27122/g.30949  ORF Transcript_27122/g.30949 Transcript_27122/m.30949 type:complete len:371 (+) Transcript_27122:304-1416(+)
MPPNNISVNTYTAGEDNGRLAALAKELGLEKQRQVQQQVRTVAFNPMNFFRRPNASDGATAETATSTANFEVRPFEPEEEQAKLDQCSFSSFDDYNEEALDLFSEEILTFHKAESNGSIEVVKELQHEKEEKQQKQETVKPSFAQRKILQARRSREKRGTCQVSLRLLENDTVLLPGDSLPVDIDIAHSCYNKYPLEEIRIRVHEVQTTTKTPSRNYLMLRKRIRSSATSTKSRDIKLIKYDFLTHTSPESWRKSAAIDIHGLNLVIPPTALCDCYDGPILVHHYLEIKLLSSGLEETIRFRFPLSIGGDQLTYVPNVHHKAFQSVVKSSSTSSKRSSISSTGEEELMTSTTMQQQQEQQHHHDNKQNER